MHRRRPVSNRGNGLKAYCRIMEQRNMDLRKALRQTERGADEIDQLVNAILAAVVDRFGEFEIDPPVIGRKVTVEKRDGKLHLSPLAAENMDTREPYARGETSCQEGTSTTPT